jgi:sugar lactone lactonase YvrE
MVFRKAIVQIYSGNEPFGFNDFIRGTLRLFNYTIDHDIDLKVNISGSEFEPYVLIKNFNYDSNNTVPRIYYMETDQELLIKELDAFMNTSDPFFYLSSNVWLDRSVIYNNSYINLNAIIRYKDDLYTAAQAKVLASLLYRPQSDNLVYGYNIIYINSSIIKSNTKARHIASIASQIRTSLDLNKDSMVFSDSVSLSKILSQYIEMNSAAVQRIDDSDIEIGPLGNFPTIRDIIIDFIILMKSKKIYRFSDVPLQSGHNIQFNRTSELLTNVYETALDINNIIGNLEITTVPLYHITYTIAGCSQPTKPLLMPPIINPALDSSGNQKGYTSSLRPGLTLDTSGNYISVFSQPFGITLDFYGNIFIADSNNHRISKLDTSGNLITIAGSSTGTQGYQDGPALNALFTNPYSIAVDRSGNLYIADTGNNAIRIIAYTSDSSGSRYTVGTLVGRGSTVVSSGSGTSILLNNPYGVAVDSVGSVYIADSGNHRICKITSGGNLITLAGSVSPYTPLSYVSGYINGQGTAASFNYPAGLTVDSIGNIYVSDTLNHVIRKVSQTGIVTTVAGSGQAYFKDGKRELASFNLPIGITIDINNTLYICDYQNNQIRRITPEGDVTTIAGSADLSPGANDGYGAIDPIRAVVQFNDRASFNNPASIAVDFSKRLFLVDSNNNTIRRIDPTFSTATKIKPVPMQSLRISHGPGVGLTLGPTLTADPPQPNTLIYGHRRGR